jgi:FkbM family methyltransferase
VLFIRISERKQTVHVSEIQHASKQDDLVYDVGMHKGEDADYYLKKGFRVIGFEANPDLVEHCRSRFSDEIENGKLIVVDGAITDLPSGETEGKKVKFYRNRNSTIWGTVADDWALRNELLGTSNEIIEVPVVDFSRCLKKYGIPHYLKIDIEGMDTVCLHALKHCDQRPDYVSIESDKVSFERLLEEFDLFTRLGYTSFKAVQQNRVSHQKEPHPSKEGCYIGYRFQGGSSGLFGEDLPGEWKDFDGILKEYRFIFLQYRLFGDYGKLSEYFVGKVIRRILSIIRRRQIPGWYDTHAKHSSVGS